MSMSVQMMSPKAIRAEQIAGTDRGTERGTQVLIELFFSKQCTSQEIRGIRCRR